jgi:hypothetical protein
MAGTLCWASEQAAPTNPRSNQECQAFAFRRLAAIHGEFTLSRAQCEQQWGIVESQPGLKQCYREAAARRASLEDALNRERSLCADKVLSSTRL